MADVVWENGPYRVERTDDPANPYLYLYTPPAGGAPLKLTVKDPELLTLLKVMRQDPQTEAMRSIIEDLRRRGIG
jgi:hypothetical protein